MLLEMKAITKTFPGVKALDNVDFSLQSGEVHGLLGENGAGKTTLVRVLLGVYPKDDGSIYINGEPVDIKNPVIARKLGIAMVHQELALMTNLSVAANISIGDEPRRRFGPIRVLNFAEEAKRARETLEMLGVKVSPRTLVKDLSVGERQLVEIARALSKKARILVLDEPTSALDAQGVESLFSVLRSLKRMGIGVIFITHKLDEVIEICDRVTVLRDGKVVAEGFSPKQVSKDEIVRMITGSRSEKLYPQAERQFGEEVVLKVDGLTGKPLPSGVRPVDISFEVHKGEIVAITGLMGAGKTETARLLWGIDPIESGEIRIEGKIVRIRSPRDACRHGIALIPEERRAQGFIPMLSVAANITLPALSKIAYAGFLKRTLESAIAQKWIETLSIACAGYKQKVAFLSGGNQQKVIVAKGLETNPKVLLVDEPTKGIDVGAKAALRKLLIKIADTGVAIVMFTSEIEEAMEIADKIIVMHRGRITARFRRREANKEEIMACAMGAAKRGVASEDKNDGV